MLKSKQIISIEGNIGSGKSHTLAAIKEKLKDKFSNNPILYVEEPVEYFREAVISGKKFFPLTDYYKDPVKGGVALQLWILEVFTQQYELLSKISTSNHVIIMDRNINSSKVFIETMWKQGLLSDFSKTLLMSKVDDAIARFFGPKKLPVDKIFFLNTPVDQCLQNISRRNRFEEQVVLDQTRKTYLFDLEDVYKRYLLQFSQKKGDDVSVRFFYSEKTDEVVDSFIEFLQK